MSHNEGDPADSAKVRRIVGASGEDLRPFVRGTPEERESPSICTEQGQTDPGSPSICTHAATSRQAPPRVAGWTGALRPDHPPPPRPRPLRCSRSPRLTGAGAWGAQGGAALFRGERDRRPTRAGVSAAPRRPRSAPPTRSRCSSCSATRSPRRTSPQPCRPWGSTARELGPARRTRRHPRHGPSPRRPAPVLVRRRRRRGRAGGSPPTSASSPSTGPCAKTTCSASAAPRRRSPA